MTADEFYLSLKDDDFRNYISTKTKTKYRKKLILSLTQKAADLHIRTIRNLIPFCFFETPTRVVFSAKNMHYPFEIVMDKEQHRISNFAEFKNIFGEIIDRNFFYLYRSANKYFFRTAPVQILPIWQRINIKQNRNEECINTIRWLNFPYLLYDIANLNFSLRTDIFNTVPMQSTVLEYNRVEDNLERIRQSILSTEHKYDLNNFSLQNINISYSQASRYRQKINVELEAHSRYLVRHKNKLYNIPLEKINPDYKFFIVLTLSDRKVVILYYDESNYSNLDAEYISAFNNADEIGDLPISKIQIYSKNSIIDSCILKDSVLNDLIKEQDYHLSFFNTDMKLHSSYDKSIALIDLFNDLYDFDNQEYFSFRRSLLFNLKANNYLSVYYNETSVPFLNFHFNPQSAWFMTKGFLVGAGLHMNKILSTITLLNYEAYIYNNLHISLSSFLSSDPSYQAVKLGSLISTTVVPDAADGAVQKNAIGGANYFSHISQLNNFNKLTIDDRKVVNDIYSTIRCDALSATQFNEFIHNQEPVQLYHKNLPFLLPAPQNLVNIALTAQYRDSLMISLSEGALNDMTIYENIAVSNICRKFWFSSPVRGLEMRIVKSNLSFSIAGIRTCEYISQYSKRCMNVEEYRLMDQLSSIANIKLQGYALRTGQKIYGSWIFNPLKLRSYMQSIIIKDLLRIRNIHLDLRIARVKQHEFFLSDSYLCLANNIHTSMINSSQISIVELIVGMIKYTGWFNLEGVIDSRITKYISISGFHSTGRLALTIGTGILIRRLLPAGSLSCNIAVQLSFPDCNILTPLLNMTV